MFMQAHPHNVLHSSSNNNNVMFIIWNKNYNVQISVLNSLIICN